MAWCRVGDRPLLEPMMTQFNDAAQYALPGFNELKVLQQTFDKTQSVTFYLMQFISHVGHQSNRPAFKIERKLVSTWERTIAVYKFPSSPWFGIPENVTLFWFSF